MAKNLKLNITNMQLAKAAGLDKFKAKLAGKEKEEAKEKQEAKPAKATTPPPATEEAKAPRIRARSKSAFAKDEVAPTAEVFKEEEIIEVVEEVAIPVEETIEPEVEIPEQVQVEAVEVEATLPPPEPTPPPAPEQAPPEAPPKEKEPAPSKTPYVRLGPTGRHINDLLPRKKEEPKQSASKETKQPAARTDAPKVSTPSKPTSSEDDKRDPKKGKKVKEFKDLKPLRKGREKTFDGRDRQGLTEEDDRWRKKRPIKGGGYEREEQIIRPTKLKIRLPLTVKELAAEMKLKASELIQKLFLHGMTYTLNDILDDETTVQFIGNEFGCEIKIDTTEQERIQITSRSIREEISDSKPEDLITRPPIVAFMGHVDHGKTSLIDAIRKSDIAAGEAGAITQHIGAFKCKTAVGDLTILDTPGHEAFSSMRARGADVTDIVVLVVAGDEGMREQTIEALQHAKAASVTIVVAINKCDKPNFNVENVYRELSEQELLPEAWGGQTITVNTSAVTGEGIQQLLEMLALQSEVLELQANPKMRARGVVLESEMHKGLGSVARVLIQNGTLSLGDALTFERHWGRVKTMHDEHGKQLTSAGPSTPVEITGLSGNPRAGDPFIVVHSEKEARDIIQTREVGRERSALQQRKAPSLDLLMQKGVGEKKILKLILRADVQGSLEALKASIQKIESDKAQADIIFTGIGEVSESDIQLAAASHAVILGFHTAIESHAESMIKEWGVIVRQFDVIYHAIEEVKSLMLGLLDKIEEERDTGSAEVRATFKSSQLGVIAGCIITEGTITRNHRVRVMRNGKMIWKGQIASLKRVKEDVKEVKKGFECGILLDGFNNTEAGDIIQAYEIIYLTQSL